MFHFTRAWLPIIMAFSGALVANDVSLDVGVGYRRDALKLCLGGPRDLPIYHTSLSWKDLRSIECQGELEATFCDQYYMRVDADYAHIYHGHNPTKGYVEDPEISQSVLIFESHLKADKGSLWDVSVAGSFQTYCLQEYWYIRPLVGYSAHKQSVHTHHGEIVFDLLAPTNEWRDFHRSDSHYNVFWNGPWTGFDLLWEIDDCWTFCTSQEIHALHHSSTGHWKLPSDVLGHFKRRGWGWGYFMKMEVDYDMCCGWQLGVQIKYNYCRIKGGKEKVKFLFSLPYEPLIILKSETRIKESLWDSFTAAVTLGYTF